MGGEFLQDFVVINEGRAKILVPNPIKYLREDGVVEPAWAPVFYNPYMAPNRTLTNLIIANSIVFSGSPKTFVEPLAGICVRSIRVLLETTVTSAFASDIDSRAVYICRKNKLLNKIDNLVIEKNDANKFMLELDYKSMKIDVVDIDPYGSPIYFIQQAAKMLAKEGILIFTATDLGTLEGKYPATAKRRYDINVFKTSFSKEIAIRGLLASVARILFMIDRGFQPLFAFYDKHYVKLAIKIQHNTKLAKENLNKIGYMCVDKNGYPFFPCNNKMKKIGPLWLGDLWDIVLVEKIVNSIEGNHEWRKTLPTNIINKIHRTKEEAKIPIPYYIRIDKLYRKTRKEMKPISKIIEEIRELGYQASRTHFENVGIRTNAPLQEIKKIL